MTTTKHSSHGAPHQVVHSPEQYRLELPLAGPTSRILAYGIGRRVEHFDQPTVRAIARAAEADGYRMSAFILGVVKSDAFRMQRANAIVQQSPQGQQP